MRILFVDDDVEVLNGIRRMLFARRNSWQMRFLSDPREALDSLGRQPADLIVSDLQMPEIDGVEVLQQVRQRCPETIRYVLTGVLDHPRLTCALRCAHHLIAKPCRPEQLREDIERAERIVRRLETLKQAALLSGLDSLPVMPEAHQKVLNMLNATTVSPRQVGTLVCEDMGMAARMVQLANSPYFGRPGYVHDPIQAVVLMGIRAVEAMVLTEGLFAALEPALVRRFGIAALQQHSLRVGMLARTICADLQFAPAQIEAASTAGILHDAGKLVFASQMQALFEQALDLSRTALRPLWQTEQQIAGIDHADLAGAMLQLWAMPVGIIEAAACHHRPAEAMQTARQPDAATLADVICIADAIDHCLCSSGADGATPEIDAERLRLLGLAESCQGWTQRHTQVLDKEREHAGQPV